MEFIQQEGEESLASSEKPRNTVIVTLPEITVANQRVRLGMHTDTILNFLSFLEDLPEKSDIKIQGRQLTRTQWELLQKNAIYRFFMMGRIVRTQAEEGIIPAFITPSDLSMTPEQILTLMQSTFSPESLQDELGFTDGYFESTDLLTKDRAAVNDLLPLLGGSNEFMIGSDKLTAQQLAEISRRLTEFLLQRDTDIQMLNIPTSQFVNQGGLIQTLKFYQSTNSQITPLTTKFINNINSNKIDKSLDKITIPTYTKINPPKISIKNYNFPNK